SAGRLEGVVSAIERADVSSLIALRALAGADDGVHPVDRQRWLTAVHEEFRRWYGGSIGQAPEQFPPGETLRYLNEHVVHNLAGVEAVELLDGAGVPAAAPNGSGDWSAVRLAPWALAELEADRGRVLELMDARIRAILRDAHGPPAAADEVPGEGTEAGAEDETPGRRRSMLVPGGLTLSARGLVKSYRGRRVVNEVDVHVAQGEIVGLLGPNGAGKTTSFYMIVGLISPDRGRVYVGERDLTGVAMYRRARTGIGYLAQEPSIFRKLTVEQNVMAILQMMRIPKAERKRRLEELLDELSIKHLRKTKAYSLSGGERRRLEITRALVSQPKFMLLDEPFAGVDPIAVHDIQQIVSDLRRRGIGVLISDHNVEQTLDIVDRAYIMYEGRVRVSGTVGELVWNDEVAEIYLGPTLTARMRDRYPKPETEDAA
ncbi:MAG TPA: LPS export ABC transporter ATP-binding protein, partial [Longimicrobiaceae bacterium]|nr:LPS export ABC transporter ATP-binding protein [Longimicrobiaceae bacterium]